MFTRGFADTLDVFVQANRTSIHSTGAGTNDSGSGNPSFGAKWRFYEGEENGFSLALKPEISLPVSAAKERAGLGTGRSSHSATFIATQEVPFGAVHANLFFGHDHYRDIEANPDARSWRASIAPVWDAAEKWKLGFDTGIEFVSTGGATTRTNFVEIGAIYSPDKDLDLALGVVRSADANGDARAATNSLTLGLTWRF